MKTPMLISLAATAVLFVGCSPSVECDDVWFEVASNYSETLTIQMTGDPEFCTPDGVVSERLRVGPDTTGFNLPYLSADPSAGDSVTYTVLDGNLEGATARCTVSADGVSLTYVRMAIDPGGAMACSCGTVEYEMSEEGAMNPCV